RPFTKLDWSSLANNRAEYVLGPARPFAELDWSISANGRAESVLGPARRTAELNPEGKIMCSKRKSSTKSRHDRSVPDGSSSRHVDVIPKVEFPAEPTDSEEVDAWRTAMGEVPEGLPTVRELLRGRPCFWADFSPKRVRRAVGLYRSRFRPNMPTKEGSESSMDGFIPYVPRTKKDRSKPCKDKHIMVDEDVVDGQFSPDNILKDYLDSQAGGSNEVLDFSKAARMVNGGLLMINRALDTSKQDAQMARFKAEVADKEIARLKDELEIFSSPESSEKEINHAYRRGKREIVEVMKSRRDKFSQKFGKLKGRYKALVDYREFRGTRVCEADRAHGGERQRSQILEVEEEIWTQWEPVPVSPNLGIPDTAESGGLDETGEVDQPVAPLDVNDYSIGRLMSGNFDLGD
ncbi:LOW QUALITY PROTEIN: hypothetical protein HID58_066940, partial [Brassica napus]